MSKYSGNVDEVKKFMIDIYDFTDDQATIIALEATGMSIKEVIAEGYSQTRIGVTNERFRIITRTRSTRAGMFAIGRQIG